MFFEFADQDCGKFWAMPVQTMIEITDLPKEILEVIFSYLDSASIMAASLVSRYEGKINNNDNEYFFFQHLEFRHWAAEVLELGQTKSGQR